MTKLNMQGPQYGLGLFFLLLLSQFSPAQATVLVPDVLIRGEAPAIPPKAGESFRIPVDIYIKDSVENARIGVVAEESEAQLQFEQNLARSVREVPEGYRLERRELIGVLEPGLDVVQINVWADMELHSDSFSFRSLGGLTEEPMPLMKGAEIYEAEHPEASRPSAVATGYPRFDASTAVAPRTVTVSGRIVMRVDDETILRGVDGATISFMQSRDVLDDIELGQTTTDNNGYYGIVATVDGTPDVYMKVEAKNSSANIGTDFFFTTYGRNFNAVEDFGGTVLNFGMRRFDTDMNHALWLLTTFTRQHRWINALGIDIGGVNCRWEDDILQSSCYLPIAGFEGIHLRSTATFDGRTAAHEYGHHVVAWSDMDEFWPPIYTNGVCDPGHCFDCPESDLVAWSEGMPYFLEHEFNLFHRGFYGNELPATRSYEVLGDCPETGELSNTPRSTEGNMAAFLVDLIDTNVDSSPLAPGVEESSNLTIQDILTVARDGVLITSTQFIGAMWDYLQQPQFDDADRGGFWEAAIINGFATDEVDPTAPAIGSPSHPVGITSYSNAPTIILSGSTDAGAGVDYYLVDVVPGPPPSEINPLAMVSEDSNLYWPTPVAEGTWYIQAAAVDRAGNQSSTSTYGPVLVGAGGDVDLNFATPGLWENYFLARHDQSVTASAGAVEPTLLANQDIWLSYTSRNSSPSSLAAPSFRHRLIVSDFNEQIVSTFPAGFMASGADYQVLNVGPRQFRGGRHAVLIELDGYGAIPESDENNKIVTSIVVQPEILTPGPWVGPLDKPYRPYMANGQTIKQRLGHRIQPVNNFAAVMLATPDDRASHELSLFAASTGWDSGFDSPLAQTASPATGPEALVFRDTGAGVYDAGVARVGFYDDADYTIRHVSSVLGARNSTHVLNWSVGDLLGMVEFNINVGQITSGVGIKVTPTWSSLDNNRELRVALMRPADNYLAPYTGSSVDTLRGDGTIFIDIPKHMPTGDYCVVVFRAVGANSFAPSMSVEVEIEGGSFPDLELDYDPTSWELPLIPTPFLEQGPNASLPPELIGGSYDTWLNFAVRNSGILRMPASDMSANLNGVPQQQFYFGQVPEIPAGGSAKIFDQFPVFVPGGRHTIEITLDSNNDWYERSEGNNVGAFQFGWKGPKLGAFSNLTQSAPPDPEGGKTNRVQIFGQSSIDGEDETIPINAWYPNANGYRLESTKTTGTPSFQAVATMSGPNSNVDLRLHEILPPTHAYGPELTSSEWGTAKTDFVVVNRQVFGAELDVSVLNAGGTEDYIITQVESLPIGNQTGSDTTYGPFGLDGPGYIQVKELDVLPGTYTISLESISGNADMGITFIAPNTALRSPFTSKDENLDRSWTAYNSPGGATETVEVEILHGQEGRAAIVVWKVGHGDLNLNQNYNIRVVESAATAECIRIDGTADSAYGPALAIQEVQTTFGNSNLGQPGEASGSELDQAFAKICGGYLHISLTGNLKSDYTDLEIFIDSQSGGLNRLPGNFVNLNDAEDFNIMGDDGSGNGLKFEPYFEADWWYSISGGQGEAYDGAPYRLFAYRAPIVAGGTAPVEFLGSTFPGARGILAGPGASTDTRVTIDNSNTAGVVEGTDADSGAGVLTGVELAIPVGEIGWPSGCVKVVAMINGKRHDLLSNQFLPPVPVGTYFVGDPRYADLSAIPGQQYFVVCQGISTDTEELPPLAATDVHLHHAAPNPFNPRTTISFALGSASEVELEIYDLMGRRVRELIAGESMSAGNHQRIWDGQDDAGQRVVSGSYLVKLKAGEQERSQRVVLLK